ncbi:MAG: NfeD family protein [Mycoplasmatales bacterium]
MDFVYALWISLIIFFILTEVIANNLVGIWFTIGAIVAIFLAALGANIIIQASAFLLISIILLFSTRKIVSKIKTPVEYKTNTDAVIGSEGKVLVKIEPFKVGVIKVGSLEWSSISESNTTYDVDEIVKVIEVKGVKAIVK